MTVNGITDPSPPAVAKDAPQHGAWLALSVLILINLFNYIDRQVLAAVEPEVRKEFFPDVVNQQTGQRQEPAEAKGWMGLLSSAFLVTYMLAAPVFGWLANRMRRWVLVGIGVMIWSLASGASGLAATYLIMFLTRCLVGVGEAAYGPVAPDMIADLYPIHHRGRVMSWFYAAIPVGSALGYTLGDLVTRSTGGHWRAAFYAVVPPGLLLALWCFLMPEPQRGQSDPAAAAGRQRERWSDYVILLKTPSYLLNTLGMTAMTFALGGLGYWVPAFLQELRVPDLWGIPPKTAFGGLTALTGLLATLLGGLAGDWLRGRYPGSYFLVSGVAMVLAFPMLLLVTWLPFPLAWLPLVACVFLLFFNTGPTNTILANVTHPRLRAPGFALNIFIIHILGDVISPPIMGSIAGLYPGGPYPPGTGLAVAFRVVSVTVLVGGVLWLWGTKYLARDTALAPHRLD
jgi:predicted MFS family arabinose efflux permease